MLTDAAARKAKPQDKPYKLTDGGGLHLFVTPAGGKLWRYRYEIAGREKLLSLGAYPAVSLADARQARDQAKATLKSGRDPAIVKKAERLAGQHQAAESFEAMAREWHGINTRRWSDKHADDVLHSLEQDVFPSLGALPVRDITAPQVLTVIREIEARGAIETASRIRQRISAVFVYAISTGRGSDDPAAPVKGALSPRKKGRQKAITDLDKARQLLRDVEATPGHVVTKLAIRLLAIVAVRPGPFARTPWHEWPEGVELWTIPAQRMKLKKDHKTDEAFDHLVPLPRQAIEIIDALRTITGAGPYAFPNARRFWHPMSENAMGYMMHRAGYHGRHVPHGFRSTFSTIMNERFPADRDTLDLMLAHTSDDETEAAYNRALYLPRRRELAQIWADLITDGLPPPTDLFRLPRR